MGKYFPRIHKTIFERFESHIISKDGCWEWRNPNKGTGYGEFIWERNRYLAHRFSYEYFNATKIPEGLQIDHICRNRACVNPDHLRVLTLKENVLCGNGITAMNKIKTHCVNGHEFTEENTYYYNNHRSCRICRADSTKKSQENAIKSEFKCVICGESFLKVHWHKKTTCSPSCAIKLSHKSSPRRPPIKIRKLCTICGNPASAKELCGKHYMQAKRSGNA